MGKLFKFLFLVALVGALAGSGSYAAAYFAQGKLVYQGYDSFPGKPRVWVFTFAGGKVPGVRNAVIITSLGGKVLFTRPTDLHDRVDHWRDSQQTPE